MSLHTSTRSSELPVTPAAAWAVLACGRPGRRWYVDAAPLVFRGLLDRLVGGHTPAAPPGRDLLRAGDRAGFWRVTRAAALLLELEAQVRSPGTITLRSTVSETTGGCLLVQSVTFRPHGILGSAYLLADLPAREALISLVHRRVCAEVGSAVSGRT